MAAYPFSKGLIGSIPTLGAALAGLATVATFTLVPAATLEDWVWSSGVAAVMPAAEPPLGITARALLSLTGGGVAAAVVWAALYLLWGPGGHFHRPAASKGTPTVRRADSHPDAPPRRPMSAADLGTPLMEVVARPEPATSVMEAIAPVERTVPADLDTPLASFDPEALPAKPDMGPALAPTSALAPGERLETFRLTPAIRLGSDPEPEGAGEPQGPSSGEPPSLDQLIRRLEQGAQRRAALG